MSSRCFLRKLYSAVTSLTHATSADSINSGTPSSDILSAQNIPSVEAGPNTNATDYDMEQVDTQDYENSPLSTADIMPDWAQIGYDHIPDNCLDFRGFDCSSAIGNTDDDCLPCSGLAASTSVDHPSLTALSSECYPSSRNMGECMEGDNHLGSLGMESYPTPVSNPSLTPKPANRVPKRKPRKATRGKAIREDKNVPASTLPALARGNLSSSNETNSPRLDLLGCLVSEACRVTNGETLRAPHKINDGMWRTIQETGDQIARDTCVILNDWSEWLLREFQPVLLPPYHSLSTVEKCVAASRILVEPKDGSHSKSIARRLAQVLLHIFVPVYAKELGMREQNGETFHRKNRTSVTMAHDFIIERVGDLNTRDRDRVVNSKNYGKRWWRLGSGIGLITVLTCAPDLAIGDMEDRTYTDDFLKLLINYVRNRYPNAVAHFQSLDPIIQSLFANTSLPTNASVRLDGLQFDALPERVQWFNTEKAMEAATEKFLRVYK
ncbi:hypothetical protein ZTR_09983 [Talaromyces verruculosus]|nr:hypothetical protein ZTR_09983 [Talaromyces verruculosus]